MDLVYNLNASFKMDVNIPDKSAIFFPRIAHDLYFTTLVGTTSADYFGFSNGRYEKTPHFLLIIIIISASESLKPYILIFTHAFKTSMLILPKQHMITAMEVSSHSYSYKGQYSSNSLSCTNT